MKLLIFRGILLAAALSSTNAFSVITSKCPTAFRAEVGDFIKRDKAEVIKFAETLNEYNSQSVENYYSDDFALGHTFVLDNKADSKCNYRTIAPGMEARAVIDGTDKAPVLRLSFYFDDQLPTLNRYELIADLPDWREREESYNFDGIYTRISTVGKSRYWQDTFDGGLYVNDYEYIYLGWGTLNVENRMKDDTTSYTNFEDCSGDLEARILSTLLLETPPAKFEYLTETEKNALSQWAFLVVKKQIIEIPDCRVRGQTFNNLVKLLSSFGELKERSFSDRSMELEIEFNIEDYNNSGQLVWIINNGTY